MFDRSGRDPLFPDFSIGDLPTFHMNPRELDDFVQIHGEGVELRRGILCPCQRIETGASRADCQNCRGIGYTYPANQREPMIVIITSREERARDLAAGRPSSGNASATFPGGVLPSRGDMILPDDETTVIQETLIRSIAEINLPALRSRQEAPDIDPIGFQKGQERLLYPEVLAVEGVWWGPPKESLKQAGMSDYQRTGNIIRWFANHGPRPGQGYTVRYRARAAYLVGEGGPMFREEEVNKYPYKVQIARLHRWGEPDLFGAP